MQLPGEFFDGGDDAGRGTIHSVAGLRVPTIANGMDNFPTRESGELLHFAGGVPRLRLREHQKIRLEPGDFFQVHLRPVLRGIDDGNSAGAAQSVGEESVLAGGNERLRPDDEEGAFRR